MTADLEAPRRRTGRPAGSPPNREAILAAARVQFAERGYDNATIRGIARAAGVDPALVHHYYGTKDALFAAALALPIRPAEVVPELLAPGVDGLGERLLRFMFSVWSIDDGNGPAVAMIRSAAAQESAATMVREFVTREMLGRIADSLEMPQAALRASLVGSQLIGIAMARFVVRIQPLADVDEDTLVACYAPTLQRYLTGPLPGDDTRAAAR